jgi:hypothetical protein
LNKEELHINDTGKRVTYSGCIREDRTGKGTYHLITPIGLDRLAHWYELGALKYGERNWEGGGMPISHCFDSMFRHMVKYLAGLDDEDHLAAIAWNAFAIMHYESEFPEMQDLPFRINKKKRSK